MLCLVAIGCDAMLDSLNLQWVQHKSLAVALH